MLKKCLLMLALAVVALPLGAEEAAPAPAPMDEAQCIAALAPESPWEQKEVATRRLRQIGTAASVPALAALLNDEKLAHLARYALEDMPAKEAAAALRKAAAEGTGAARIGAIISLGARGDADAVPVVADALKDASLEQFTAAAGALGRIGTVEAAKALKAATAPEGGDAALGEGLLAAAEHLIKRTRNKEAVEIATLLQESRWPEQVRYGAFAVLINAERSKSSERLLAALAGEDAKLRDYAAFLVATMPRVSATRQLCDRLPSLPHAGQAALLTGLAGRKDAAARPAALNALSSPDPAVQLAAIRGLGAYGAAQDVARLASFLANGDASDTARTALAEMTASGVDAALAKATEKEGHAERKALLLGVLAERMAPQTNTLALAALGSDAAPVRLAALGALAKLGAKSEVPTLIEAVKKASDASERTEGANALAAIAGMQKDDVLEPISTALAGASPELRVILLGSLLRIGSGNALAAYVANLAAGGEGQDEAVRLFAGWPTQEAAQHLLEMAKTDEAHRTDLLRGYVRLAIAEQDAAAKMAKLNAAMEVAKRPEEIWIVLPGWGSLHTPESLARLNPLLDDAPVRNEAGLAMITAATALAKQGPEAKKIAVEALQGVLAKVDNEAIKARTQKAIETIGPIE